jgi:hypothetical protein
MSLGDIMLKARDPKLFVGCDELRSTGCLGFYASGLGADVKSRVVESVLHFTLLALPVLRC